MEQNFNKSNEKKRIWNDYFSNIRNKYSMRASSKNPLIINFDGKGITNNTNYNLIDTVSQGGFLDTVEKTVKYFSKKYNCISIYGADEISFIFENPMILVDDLNTDSNKKIDEIISVFSQYFFNYFNTLNTKGVAFWHGECFSIPKDKINSYVKYKSNSIKNTIIIYFLKKNGVKNLKNLSLLQKLELCQQYDYFNEYVKNILGGVLYYNGKRIEVDSFFYGVIKEVEAVNQEDTIEILDLNDWN